MSETQEIPELDGAGLRKFAVTIGVAVVVLFGLFFPWLLGVAWPLWPWVLAGVLGLWGCIAPTTLRPVYLVWMRFGLVLHGVMTPLILSVVFFLVVTPAAIIMKVIGRDTMARSRDGTLDTYRVLTNKQPREKMEKPF